jgi:hypothetical protein
MYSTLMKLGSIDMQKDPEFAFRNISRMLGTLTAINADFLEQNPNFPLLYMSGVRYHHDKNADYWRDAKATFDNRFGDCDNLSCWRAAELQVRFGINALPVWLHKKKADQTDLFHIVVQYPNLDIEDPSVALGMRLGSR